jgi:hypothetical protein
MVLAEDVSKETDMEVLSRTELDSHANMPVVGRNADVNLSRQITALC